MAEAATADDYASLTPRQRKARKVAGMGVTSGGHADYVDVVALSDIEAAVAVGRTVAGDIREEAQELLADGYAPTTAYGPRATADETTPPCGRHPRHGGCRPQSPPAPTGPATCRRHPTMDPTTAGQRPVRTVGIPGLPDRLLQIAHLPG
ncbi:hypothetical protein AB0G55_21350 [Streptomyces toyocaensis]|nr:hypothetical protein [Streptomyces toyocaensis]